MSPVKRAVVVGAGMAAARLVDRLVAGGAGAAGLHVTVLGDEPHAPYNRILLSAALEGTHRPAALGLADADGWAAAGVDLRTSARVVALDRDGREVVLADGARVPWDALVLATGSVPTLPPVRGLVGLDGRLHPAVHAFRSRADLDRLDAAVAARDVRRAVVVGGGLLGLQVARALSVRGLDTEVVEGAEHVLHRQVGPAAGAVLARHLRRLGTAVYTGARATRLVAPPADERVGLALDNGFVLGTDLVVLTAGGRPSAALARAAGLEVRRGVVVDDTLTTSDPTVHAVGDCAEHRGRTTGHVAPAWEQADVLAARLLGGDARHDGSRTVARLRATGLDVAVVGDRDEPGEVVEVSNPVAGSHRRLVVREGRIVAATLVGDLSRVGLITQHHDRGTRLGSHEPGALLMAERSQAGPAEAALPDAAEVCACAGVSAGAIRACASFDEARATTRATTGCGGCTAAVRQVLARRARPQPAQQGVPA